MELLSSRKHYHRKSSTAAPVKKMMKKMMITSKAELTYCTLTKTVKRHPMLTNKKSATSFRSAGNSLRLKKHICSISKKCKELSNNSN